MRTSIMGDKWPIAVMLIISGILNAFYFIPIVVTAFRGKKENYSKEKGGELRLMLVPTLVLVGVALAIGVWPGLVWPGVEVVVDWFFRV